MSYASQRLSFLPAFGCTRTPVKRKSSIGSLVVGGRI